MILVRRKCHLSSEQMQLHARAHSLVSKVQSLSCVQLFATPWTAACQVSLSITNSRSLLKLMSIESVMPSNHLILYRPLLLPPSIFPSIRTNAKTVQSQTATLVVTLSSLRKDKRKVCSTIRLPNTIKACLAFSSMCILTLLL